VEISHNGEAIIISLTTGPLSHSTVLPLDAAERFVAAVGATIQAARDERAKVMPIMVNGHG
jgi:hypothetical protein